MGEQGFIKLHRSILSWEWWKDKNTRIVFLHLLLTANWKDKRYRGISIPAGSLITSRKKLCVELGLSDREVRTALEHLQKTGEIIIEATNRYSLVTIANWELYQLSDSEATNKRPANRPTNRPTSDQQNDQPKVLQLKALSNNADQQQAYDSTNQSTNQSTTYKEYKNIRNKNDYYNKSKFDANKGLFPDNYNWDEIERDIGYIK